MAATDDESASADEPRPGAEPPDRGGAHREELLDEQEEESFPASDPHSDWSG